MSSSFVFNDYDAVFFDDGVVSGIGTIRGCTTIPLLLVGRVWIIQFTREKSNISWEEYPYECIGIFECNIRKLTDQELEEYNMWLDTLPYV